MSDVSQPWQQYVIRFTAVTTICHTFHITCCDAYGILLSWFRYVSPIVISVMIRNTYCCLRCGTQDIVLMSYVSQQWQQYVIRFTSLTTLCLTHHNAINNMSYVSQQWQKYVLHITLLSVLWYARCIVVNVLIRKTNCCQCCDNKTYCWYCCDTKDIILSMLWCVRHIVVTDVSYISHHWQQYVLCIITLTTICLTYHKTDKAGT
jgi:hypothetical protein